MITGKWLKPQEEWKSKISIKERQECKNENSF